MESQRIKIFFKQLPHGKGLSLPQYMTSGSSGMDILAAIEHDITISPGEITLIPTGLTVAIPHGYEFQIRPRSGLAIKHGLTVVNSPGTIDADYRGEIKVGLINLGKQEVKISRGDRIAQMVLSQVSYVEWEEIDQLPETKRGAGGFGHTGTD